jgi:hypothetical protein
MSQAIRQFIRESLVMELGGSYSQDMRLGPVKKPETDPNITYAGILGSFSPGAAPDYVVVADNRKDRVVIRKHSKSLALDDDNAYIQNLNAKKINIEDQLLRQLLISRDVPRKMDDTGNRFDTGPIGTWGMIDYDKAQLEDDITLESGDTLDNYFFVDRANIAWSPQIMKQYTDLYKQNLLDFKCNLNIGTAVYYVMSYEPASEEGALGAACFYRYATETENAVPAALLGALAGAVVTKNPLGALAGAGTAYSIQEIIARAVVARWARANNLDDFYVANIVYIFVNVFFLALSALKDVKMLKDAALRAGLAGPLEKLAKFTGVSRIPAFSTWAAAVPFLAEMIIQCWAYFDGESELQLHKSKIEDYLRNSDTLDADVSASVKALTNSISKNYPSR